MWNLTSICWIYGKCYIFFISQGLLFLDLFLVSKKGGYLHERSSITAFIKVDIFMKVDSFSSPSLLILVFSAQLKRDSVRERRRRKKEKVFGHRLY
jgi:hypothetical protein